MIVGFDIDGVLFNFGDSVQRYLEHIGKGDLWKSGPTPTPYWDFYKDWGWTTEQFLDMCNAGADAGFIFAGPCRENAVDAVTAVKQMGHRVVIITDRPFGSTPKVSQKLTRDWLSQHNIPYDELHFSRDKTCVRTDMFVEDKLENYDALKAVGTDAYLINRPWNAVDGGDDRLRITDVKEFALWVALKSEWLRNLTSPK